MNSSQQQIAIIGGGSIGTRHAKNLRDLGCENLLLIEINPARADELRALGFDVSTQIDDAFADDIDAVCICSPTMQHHDHLRRAVATKKHLFIEKPISHTFDGLDDILQAAEDAKLVSLVGFNMRFRDGFKRAKAFLESGRLGRSLAARANISYFLPHYHPDKDYRGRYQAQKAMGGGVIFDDIHELDYLTHLFGDAAEVFAYVDTLSDLEIDVEDYAAVTIKHQSGVITQLQMDYLQHVYRRQLEITGSDATLTLDHNSGEIRIYGPQDHRVEVYPQKMSVHVNDMYVDEMRHFLACLAGDEQPIADLRRGYAVQRLAMAIFESAQDKKVVAL